MFNRLSRRRREEFEYQALPHLDALIRTAARLCASVSAAEDAVQETYFQAWKYWHTFQPGTNCRAWLFRILFNVIKKTSAKEKDTVQLDEAPAGNLLFFETDRHIETYEALEVFEQLTEEHRTVLILVAVEQLSYKEAASVLEVPVGTVMSRLNRARAELRRRLGQGRRQQMETVAEAR